MSNQRRTSISVVISLCVFSARLMLAQSAPDRVFAGLTSDSVAWQRTLVYIVGALSTQLVSAGNDPTPQPWQVRLPPKEPQRHVLETQLRTLLRAREVVPGDSVVRSLEIGPLKISSDTARVEVRFNETRKCSGNSRTTGWGWSTTVLVPREPQKKFWGAARSRTTSGGDRVPC